MAVTSSTPTYTEEHLRLKLTTTAGDDKYEKSHCSPSQPTENASLTATVQHDYHVQTRQGNPSD